MHLTPNKTVINLREAEELTEKLTAAHFPGRTMQQVEAQAATAVYLEPRYREEVPVALYRIRQRAAAFGICHACQPA